jgi:hypothetical protein
MPIIQENYHARYIDRAGRRGIARPRTGATARADPACGSLIATGKFCPDETIMDERE